MRTFGGTTSDVVLDIRTGRPPTSSRTALTVWTDIDGSPITDLLDINGNPLDGDVPVSTNGSYRFKIDSDTWDLVWIRDSNGNWWRSRSEELDRNLSTVVQDWTEVAAIARRTESALGQISRTVATYATDEQMAGTADAASAFQACFDDLPEGGRVTIPPGSTWWFEGPNVAQLRSGIELDLWGGTITKTTDLGYYCAFAANSVSDVTIRNGYFRGRLNTGGNLCVLAAHHASNVLIDNCQFDGCQGGGHTFDLGGCDGVTFRDCTWRGFDPISNPQHAETIQCDISYRGAVSYPDDPATYDGAHTKNVTLDNCRFLPWTDPDSKISYPAPIPIGSHTFVEGQYYENITLRNVTVVDPWSDASPGGILQDNSITSGLVHFACVKGLTIDGMTVLARTPASIRAVMFASRNNGVLANSDFAGTATSGTWAKAQGSSDIKISRLTVNGMSGDASTLNPLIVGVGMDGTGKCSDIKIDLSADVAYRQFIQLYNCTDIDVHLNAANSISVGCRLVKCSRANVAGNFAEVAYTASVDGSDHISVGPITATKAVDATRPVVVLVQTTTGASSYVTLNGVNATGWSTLITSTTSLTNVAKAGNIPA